MATGRAQYASFIRTEGDFFEIREIEEAFGFRLVDVVGRYILSLGMRDVVRNTRNISDRFSRPKLETAGFYSNFDEY